MASITAQDRKALVKDFARRCEPFCKPDVFSALWQLITTIGLYGITTSLTMWLTQNQSSWWLLLNLVTGGLIVRLFILQHDCGHQSFLPTKRSNDIVGHLLSVFTLTPYEVWRREHNKHHAGSGNLAHRGVGDIDVLTVREYQALAPLWKYRYRIMRNPLFLLFVGGPCYFIILNRVPWLRGIPSNQAWRNIVGLDVAVAIIYGTLGMLLGWKLVAMTILPSLYIATIIGVYLFYVQHQFEHTLWDSPEKWDFKVAAVYGSSYYELPRVLAWFTGDIGIHHVHHLVSRVPNYRLRECLAALPELQTLNRLTFWDTVHTFRLRLWDEDKKCLVGFP